MLNGHSLTDQPTTVLHPQKYGHFAVLEHGMPTTTTLVNILCPTKKREQSRIESAATIQIGIKSNRRIVVYSFNVKFLLIAI